MPGMLSEAGTLSVAGMLWRH